MLDPIITTLAIVGVFLAPWLIVTGGNHMLDWIRENLLTSNVRAAIITLIIAVAGAAVEALTRVVETTGGAVPTP